MKITKLTPSYNISPIELGEAVELNPQLKDDDAFQKIIKQVEASCVSAMGIPGALLDMGLTSTNATNASGYSAMNIEALDVAMEAMRKWQAVSERRSRRLRAVYMIQRELPDWITRNRHELARHLWVAHGVFELNLRVQAQLHRLGEFRSTLPPAEAPETEEG